MDAPVTTPIQALLTRDAISHDLAAVGTSGRVAERGMVLPYPRKAAQLLEVLSPNKYVYMLRLFLVLNWHIRQEDRYEGGESCQY